MAGPFPDRTREAVAACTRALSGATDVDAMLVRANAATLSGLRAYGDRLAVRERHHRPTIHRDHQPTEMRAAALFADLEQARLDALGVQWLRGVAANLLAHPGADRDGLRWLAFELLSGRSSPQVKKALVADARDALPARLVTHLEAMAASIHDQSTFAAAAAAWVEDAGAHVAPAAAATSGFPLPRVEVVRTVPKRGDPGATAAPLTRHSRDDAPADSDGASGTSGNVGSTGTLRDHYHPYTTAHDRVVNAITLASRDELAELRARLDAELTQVRSVVARLAKRLMRVLMAKQVRQWRFDLDEGLLDGSRLATLVASGGHARPFKQETDSPFPGTVVSLLIDHSGSMRGRPMLIAALTVEIFARVLERCGVRCEVLGFTTRDWDGGEPAKEWAANGYPEKPGRLNALEHIIIKSADVPWRRARAALGLFLHHQMLKENIDGEALAWAHGRLLTRTEPRRILVVVSDGTPMDEATMAANGHEYLEDHLLSVVTEIEARSPVQLAAIGIGHDVKAFYRNATTIARIDQLGPALSAKLTALLEQ